MSLQNKIVTPQSILIETTARECAKAYYEVGSSQGLFSKYKTHRAFANAYLERFIPQAVSVLIDMMGNSAIPEEQKKLIYDAIMERTNDKELSNIGLPIFDNPIEWTSDAVIPQKPIIANTPKLDDILKPKPYIKGMN